MPHFLLRALLLTGCLLPLLLAAQSDTLAVGNPVDQAIEDLIINVESDEQVDYTFITDYLEDLRERPLNLNRATREELIRLPGMSDVLAASLIEYVQQFGDLTSVYELQAVPGFREEVIRQILPFVSVAGRAKDISPGKKHPSGLPPGELLDNLKVEFIQRMTGSFETARGFLPDTSFRTRFDDNGEPSGTDTVLSSRFEGSPYRHYSRLRVRSGPYFSLALTGESDPGEPFRWEPDQRYYGYDFLSGHIALQNYGALKRLVLGDYNLQVGQGMVLSRGLGFGKGSQSILVKMPNTGLLPYSSVNENQFMRGAAATVAAGDFYFTGFFSRLNVDATIQDSDSATLETLLASGLQTSGLHRTASEIANRKSITETVYGGRVEYRRPRFVAGITHYQQSFSAPLQRPLNDYNRFEFRGDQNFVTGADFDWILRNFNFFGEVGRSQNGAFGAVAGLMGSIAPTVDVSLVARHYDIDFQSNKAYVFGERPTAAQNETGLYLGLRIAPNPKWEWNSYFDQFYFPYNKFRTSYPSSGWEFLTQVDYKPKRGTVIYLRYRSDNRQVNASEFPAGQQMQYLVPARKDQFRLHAETKIGRDIIYRTRLEFAWYTRGAEERSTGVMLYQDLVWKIGFKYRIAARYAIFDAADYDARIYAYENDILGFFSIPPYYGRGSRAYAVFDWKITKGVEVWLRIARTHYQETESFGTGLNEVEGNKDTEFKAQVRFSF